MAKPYIELLLDREMVDEYLTILAAYSPEDADRMDAAYENTTTNAADAEEWAGMLTELLEEHGIDV